MASKKPLYKSLTIQSSCLLALLIVLRAFFPDHLTPELFQTFLGVFGLGAAIGFRRALPVLIIGFVSVGMVHCGPSYCSKTVLDISAHPSLPSPAATLKVKCCKTNNECTDKAIIVTKDIKK